MRRRLAAMVLAFEAITCGLAIAVAATVTQSDRAVQLLTFIAVTAVLASAVLRRPFGFAIGWALQAVMLGAILFVPAFAFVAIPFAVLWWFCLRVGGRIDREREQLHGDPAAG